jgi:hypothetical protein
VTIDEIADLLVSSEAEALPSGNYVNRRGVLGYFMQVKCGPHWCKVSVSHVERHADRTTAKELNEIDPRSLQPAVAIPVESTTDAFRSPEGRRAPLNKYENTAGIEGIWAEFRFERNWYMISVSHIDLPARLSTTELETLTDEFLYQQGGQKKRRRFQW